MTEIAPCPRCHYGAGPQGAERYWEARWRDEKAHNDALVNDLDKAVRLIDALLGLEKGSADAALAFIGQHCTDVSTPKDTSPPGGVHFPGRDPTAGEII